MEEAQTDNSFKIPFQYTINLDFNKDRNYMYNKMKDIIFDTNISEEAPVPKSKPLPAKLETSIKDRMMNQFKL